MTSKIRLPLRSLNNAVVKDLQQSSNVRETKDQRGK